MFPGVWFQSKHNASKAVEEFLLAHCPGRSFSQQSLADTTQRWWILDCWLQVTDKVYWLLQPSSNKRCALRNHWSVNGGSSEYDDMYLDQVEHLYSWQRYMLVTAETISVQLFRISRVPFLDCFSSHQLLREASTGDSFSFLPSWAEVFQIFRLPVGYISNKATASIKPQLTNSGVNQGVVVWPEPLLPGIF